MATLKIRELSVDDWVLMDGEPAQALRLTMAGRLIFKGLSGQIYGSLGNNIYPLPIVPEILEKNGFVKNGEYNEWSTGNWRDMPFIGISLSRQSMRIKDLGTDIFFENKVVYVHQLQHALRLAGVDKEINL